MTQCWRCLVCGFAASGGAPPEACPACGAERSQFFPVGRGKVRFLRDVWDTFLLHPVAAHTPSGVLPAAALFLLLAFLWGEPALERTAFSLLALVLIAVPMTAAAGARDWKRRYGGRRVPVFRWKLALSAVLFVLCAAAVGLRLAVPELFAGGSPLRFLYAALIFLALVPAVLLGHFGGKLVFHWRKR